LNLICAARYATSDIAEVALVGHADLNDEKCFAMPATKVRKMHSSRRDAFKVINDEPIAEITKEKIKFLKEFNARDNSKKVKVDAKFLNQIAVIKIHPGISPEILDYYAEKKYKGIIIETTGLGHTPTMNSTNNWIPRLKKTIEKGITICGTAQTIFGGLNPNVYSPGRELQKTGMIFLKDMLSETAYVKLGWILGHKSWASDKDKIREKMLENISKEFNEKIGFN
jgi:glutamyl-tRNA(Gln) amidotransferase subunit D